MLQCPYCKCELFGEASIDPVGFNGNVECDQCGAAWAIETLRKNQVVEIRKSSAYLQKELNEAQAQVRGLEKQLSDIYKHAIEMQTAFAYVLRESLGGELKLSVETLNMVQKSRNYTFGINVEQGGVIRVYSNESMRLIKVAGSADKPLISIPGRKKNEMPKL